VVTATLLSGIEVIRFASGYGLLVCFMFTYALLQERAAAMLRFHSDHDALTNCLNRRTFNEALDELQQRGGSAAFALIDIDHFKSINDQHGHLIGDRAITEVAARLGQELDGSTALYRYGGEEFALLLEGATLARARELAERLRHAVAATPLAGLSLTVSIGVAEWAGRPAPIAEALARADMALYQAKRNGRNCVEVRVA
jgi:diguanylate cyclase (GGDEF)-like protein